ncbi:MAG: universal stress protein [Chloroflexi bacterium]|nr:MAG: universal stress protein [Chloroflexota bacterium]TMD91682.1 MAG: universal stress protein [Chloroflexota bacterium]
MEAVMFSKILVAVGGPEDAEELVPVVAGLAKVFEAKVLVVHMRERVVTSAATLEKETIPEAFRFGEDIADQLVSAGVDASADTRGHRPNMLAEFILDEAKKFGAELIVLGGHHAHGMHDRIFGDIGKTLAHGSKCPLLLMPSGPQ